MLLILQPALNYRLKQLNSSPLLSFPPDYALRHPSQLLKSSHFFFFQLPRFPELMLSINDFKVVCYMWA